MPQKPNINKFRYISTSLLNGLNQIVFPNICVCCGIETTEKQRQLCSFCLEERFEYAGTGASLSSGNVILPDHVYAQFALWKFDKGGNLQQLLHDLKYDRLTQIGITLGRKLAHRLSRNAKITDIIDRIEPLMVPVPLHYLKFRKRGFNQAFYLALGVHQVLKIPICEPGVVTRTKNTRSQTGYSLEKRIENMKGAFKVTRAGRVRGRLILIVDDVFTTGSTSFELSRTLAGAGSAGTILLTAAQA